MQPTSKYSTGLRFGLIIGLIYAILLFVRFNFFAGSPLSFGLFAIVSYLLILVLYLFAGISRKKELGGYADFKDIFQTIFISILITEAVYVIFTSAYLRFIDPSFWDNFKVVTRNFFEKAGMTQDQIDAKMKGFDEANKEMTPWAMVKGYGTWVIIDSIVGMIYSSILRKKKDIFQETKL